MEPGPHRWGWSRVNGSQQQPCYRFLLLQFHVVLFSSSQLTLTQTFVLKTRVSKAKGGFELPWEALIVNPLVEHGRV